MRRGSVSKIISTFWIRLDHFIPLPSQTKRKIKKTSCEPVHHLYTYSIGIIFHCAWGLFVGSSTWTVTVSWVTAVGEQPLHRATYLPVSALRAYLPLLSNSGVNCAWPLEGSVTWIVRKSEVAPYRPIVLFSLLQVFRLVHQTFQLFFTHLNIPLDISAIPYAGNKAGPTLPLSCLQYSDSGTDNPLYLISYNHIIAS